MNHESLHVDAWAYILEALPPEQMHAIKSESAENPSVRRALDEACADLALLSEQSVPRVEPSDAAKAAFADALAFESPFASMLQGLSRLADLPAKAMKALLTQIEDLSQWEPGPCEGVTIFHVDGGPQTQGAVVGFVKIPPGCAFDEHHHEGAETSYMLQGTLTCSLGHVVSAGEVLFREAGTTHTIFNHGDDEVIFFVVVHHGVTLNGMLIGPGDPAL